MKRYLGILAAGIAMAVPAPTANFAAIQHRFGFRLASLYGMTDLGLPILTPPEEARPGCAGLVQPGWECKIVDENVPLPKLRGSSRLIDITAPPFLFPRPIWTVPSYISFWRLADLTES